MTAPRLVDENFLNEADLVPAVSDANIERLEDMHRKEIAFCANAKARVKREAKSDCASIDQQILALQQRRAQVKANEKVEVANFDRREGASRAYLAAIGE